MHKFAQIAFAVSLAGVAVQAEAISVSLGAGSQSLTLYGQGAVAPGIGSFTVSQGASSFDGVTSTFLFSGAITGGDPGLASGTYSFVTTYAGANTPQGGPNAPLAQSNPSDTTFFFYNAFDTSTTTTLFLNTPGQTYAIPLVSGGKFVAGTDYFFKFIKPTCTGIVVCNQNGVGLTPGATISGPVTISASFAQATSVPRVPEPSTWAMLIVGFGGIGIAARSRRSTRSFAA